MIDRKTKITEYARALLILIALIGTVTGLGYVFEYLSLPEMSTIIAYVIFTPIILRAAKGALDAKEKEAETAALYKLTNRLTDAQDIDSIAETAITTISEVIGCNALFLCFGNAGLPDRAFLYKASSSQPVWHIIPNEYEMQIIKKRIENLKTAYEITGEYYNFPINGQEKTLGVVCIPTSRGKQLSERQIRMLLSMIENTTLAMDRFYSAKEIAESREETEKERLRADFLRSISHDLRTPLTGISGNARVLMQGAGSMTDEKKNEIYSDIFDDSTWLKNVVENLLSITRIENEGLSLNMQPELLSEIIEESLSHITYHSTEHTISVDVQDDFLMAKMDARLIVQVIFNLLDNAIKFSNPGTIIAVKAHRNGENVCVEISDEGLGISRKEKQKIFDMYYTQERSAKDKRRGLGLGLYLCKVIISAHGGEIFVKDNKPKGTIFGFTLRAEDISMEKDNTDE